MRSPSDGLRWEADKRSLVASERAGIRNKPSPCAHSVPGFGPVFQDAERKGSRCAISGMHWSQFGRCCSTQSAQESPSRGDEVLS